MNKGDIVQVVGKINRNVQNRIVSWEEEAFDVPMSVVFLGKTIRWEGEQIEADFRFVSVGWGEVGEEFTPGYIKGTHFDCYMVVPSEGERYYKPFEILESQIV